MFFLNRTNSVDLFFETEIAKDGDISRKLENGTFISVPEGADFCVFPTDSSFSRLLRDLYIEAKNKNLQEFQVKTYFEIACNNININTVRQIIVLSRQVLLVEYVPKVNVRSDAAQLFKYKTDLLLKLI